ncbi:MAG: CBS domain-containing protein [Acidobacteriia bacterium]|nr:CBS domain-containing protein [Methyloceanibacter sp.]MCL6491782.1 CBS domain-containing protein [Terriglobia bacterium]
MKARDIMTTEVVSVHPDMPIQQVAQLLLERGISAAPVVDEKGDLLGIVSEGDLIGRDEQERLARRDWWLALLAGKQPFDEKFQARLQGENRKVREVMSAPVVTVTEETEINDIARLLAVHSIKRVPVVRENRVVGIVSRADLVRAMLAPELAATAKQEQTVHRGFLGKLLGHHKSQDQSVRPPASRDGDIPKAGESTLTAADFQRLVEDFQNSEVHHREETRRDAARARQERVKELIDAHIFDEGWRDILHHAREAAAHGEKEFLLLRFPSQLCSDGGRAINVGEPNWPATLRGEAAEIYLRWERDLKPRGFHLSARVLEFPGGMPGDIGLYLTWPS